MRRPTKRAVEGGDLPHLRHFSGFEFFLLPQSMQVWRPTGQVDGGAASRTRSPARTIYRHKPLITTVILLFTTI